MDWLTATVPTSVGRLLITESSVEGPGKARFGFNLSEQRAVLGGTAWRRWEPMQLSEHWGIDYESWEYVSEAARWGAETLRGRECRPSRVDVAWDYEVPEDFKPDDLIDRVQPHVKGLGLTIGISGQDGRNTRYIGSASSERRIRVYRKDWQQPNWMFGPTLRVEQILRGERAQAWWQVWNRDQESGYAAAAGHVLLMTGLQVQQAGPVPVLEPVEGSSEAQQVLQFLDQHASTFIALEDAGIPIAKLARTRAEKSSRMTKYRAMKLRQRMERAGPARVTALVRDLLAARSQASPYLGAAAI